MDNKPKMYKNKEDKVFHNNKLIYMSSDKNNRQQVMDSNNIRKKINDIINANTFIYQTKVNIVLGNEIITRKIIGIFNNNLVTLNNEYISLENITDIYK